ncbi:MAG: sigma-70 family RNA polymerase sigma factor [Bacteroidia bacterium]
MNRAKAFENYTDSEVIRNILAGESRLYEILIRRNNPYLYRIGRSYGYNHHDVEDLMQETYISAYKNLSGFQHTSAFKTWITSIMLNHCYHKKQKHSYQKEILTEKEHNEKNNPMFHQTNNTGNSVLNKELGHVLENALSKIPDDYRLVFTLRELNGLSISETVEVTNLSEANVKTRLNRAKAMLRGEIEKLYSVDDIYEFNLVYCDKIVERVMQRISSEKL